MNGKLAASLMPSVLLDSKESSVPLVELGATGQSQPSAGRLLWNAARTIAAFAGGTHDG
jgi:hypothetical protein